MGNNDGRPTEIRGIIMKVIYYLFAFLLAALAVDAQIQQEIGDYPLEWGRSLRGGLRPFVGSFKFINLPEPLKPVKVNFTLEATGKGLRPEHYNEDWTIRLLHLDNYTRLLSDTLFYWPGPHNPGDKFSDYIEFIPLQSGQNGMTLYLFGFGQMQGVGASESGLTFQFCLDEDGQLEYLGPGVTSSKWHFPICTFFFGPDSVRIVQHPEERDNYAFEYKIVIKPLPQIGDTTMIYYYLTANNDMPDGCEMEVYGLSMEYISTPEPLDFPISRGQKTDFILKAVPKAVRNNHGVTLSFNYYTPPDIHRHGQTIPCRFVFNSGSTLKYINNIGFNYAPENIYPDNLPCANADYDNIYILWDSTLNDYIIHQTKKPDEN